MRSRLASALRVLARRIDPPPPTVNQQPFIYRVTLRNGRMRTPKAAVVVTPAE